MKPAALFVAVAAGLALSPVAGNAGERARAHVECQSTHEKLTYDCAITLMARSSGKPIAGATIVVNADMPSMPMAHNVAPVTATAGGTPGQYHARLELEMHGEWALRMTVSGPIRDVLIHKARFGASEADHGGHQMGHGGKSKHR